MRAFKIVVLIWLAAQLSLWIRGQEQISLLETLPFVQRRAHLSPEYDWLALGALLIGLWGYLMLRRQLPLIPPAVARPPQQTQQPGQFRAGLVLVPVAIIFLTLLSRRLALAVRFEDLVGVTPHTLANRHLAMLSVCVFTVLLAIKTLRDR